VCGLCDGTVQKRLLAIDTLTFADACKTAIMMETPTRDAQDIDGSASPQLHKIDGKEPQHKRSSRKYRATSANHPKQPCLRCVDSTHLPTNRRYIQTTCNFCGKPGHLERVCLSKKRAGFHRNVKQVTGDIPLDPGIPRDPGDISIDGVTVSRAWLNPIWVTPTINNSPMKMELDTRAAVSLLPSTLYHKYFQDIPLHPCTATL